MSEDQDNFFRQKYLNELASIKSPGDVDTVSNEEFAWRIKEIAKCKRDIKYFAQNWFKIIHPDYGLVTIKLYPKQSELLDFIVKNKRAIVLASRQSSKTTTYTIYLLWLCIFHNQKKAMILANKADTSLEIVSRISLAYQYLPSFLKPSVLTYNKGEIIFGNMSQIKGFSTSSDAARGYSCNCVHGNTYITIRFKFFPFIKFKVKMSTLEKLAKILNKIYLWNKKLLDLKKN